MVWYNYLISSSLGNFEIWVFWASVFWDFFWRFIRILENSSLTFFFRISVYSWNKFRICPKNIFFSKNKRLRKKVYIVYETAKNRHLFFHSNMHFVVNFERAKRGNVQKGNPIKRTHFFDISSFSRLAAQFFCTSISMWKYLNFEANGSNFLPNLWKERFVLLAKELTESRIFEFFLLLK